MQSIAQTPKQEKNLFVFLSWTAFTSSCLPLFKIMATSTLLYEVFTPSFKGDKLISMMLVKSFFDMAHRWLMWIQPNVWPKCNGPSMAVQGNIWACFSKHVKILCASIFWNQQCYKFRSFHTSLSLITNTCFHIPIITI